MESEKVYNTNNWYMGAVTDIIGDEAIRNYQVYQPIRFIRIAEEHDFDTYNLEGFINYESMIIPIIVAWSPYEKFVMGEPVNTCLLGSHLDTRDGFILVGKYIWDHYQKKSHNDQRKLFNNMYQFVANFMDPEFFETMYDVFTVSHIGFKEFKKSLFELDDIRSKYHHKKKMSECEKVKKYGDRLLNAKNVNQRCGLRIGYWDFGWIYFKDEPKIEESSEE